MSSKERVMISILVVMLSGLVLCVGIKRFGLFREDKQVVKENQESIEVIQMMSELENQTAHERYLKKLEEWSETTSCSDEYLNIGTDSNEVFDTDQVKQEELSNHDSTTEKIGVRGDKIPEYSKLYPDMYVDKVCPQMDADCEKIAYLTFDDGPSENTLQILDILKEKDAVATFFILGSTMTEDGKEAVKEMQKMGCTIGLHTYSHDRRKLYASVESFLNDMNQVYTQVYELTGVKPNIYRFPWGSYNGYCKGIKKDIVSEMERRGFTYYDWNVSAEDSVGKPTAYSIMKNIMKDVKKYNYPVILMHDSNGNKLTMQTLPAIIDRLIELGYSFGTLDQREPCQFCY